VVVILLFLNFSFRSTLVTAVSIPTSIAIAFALMYLLPANVHQFLLRPDVSRALPEGVVTFLIRLFPASLTLNIMTLSGLTVAIGRVVDDSIVVLENIYRQIQTGIDPREAVLRGTRDVSVAIFAATLTTVVVFLPIGLTGGIVGEFFMPFGLAVTYSLAASFVVAITIVPVLAYLFISQKNVPAEKEGRLASAYHGAIEWALSHRWAVLGIAGITLVFGMVLFATRPTTFLPSFGEPQITVTVSMPSGTPIAQTDVRVHQLEDYLKTLTDNKSIRKYQVTIGSGGGLESFVGGNTVNGAAAQIVIAPDVANANELTTLTAQIRAKAEAIFASPKNVKVSKASLSESGFGGFALVLTGPEDTLRQLNADVIKTLATVPGLANITSSLDLVPGATASTYLRINQTASVKFSGELETQNTLGVTREAIKIVQAMPNLPPNVTVGEGFQSQEQTKGFSQMVTSLGIAVIIVYVVMVVTLGSLVHPFTILFSLPLAVVGAALGLTLTNRVLGISAMIGMLMLVGIVVTNAIVLIDRVQANRKERGMSARDALIEGGRTRLRPILMTAIATMFALLPLAIGLSEGAIIASELGTVVIGGLFSSTLLTLLVVPVVYSLLDAAQGRVLRRKVEAPSVATGD
jgi:hydrophobic/amphiphilic exporter-1 (mainly G- bacteria), HAE1 family